MTPIVRGIAALTAIAALAIADLALAAPSGHYSGTTSQTLGAQAGKISLKVSHNKLAKVQLEAFIAKGSAFCANVGGGVTLKFSKIKIKIGSHNKFKGTLRSGHVVVTISGAFKGKIVTGSFTASLTENSVSGIHTCSSGKVTFAARG